MMERYIKETRIAELGEDDRYQELIKNIMASKKYLNNIYKNLEFADSDLIDYYTYQIKAEEAKYGYLIKQIKKIELSKK